MSVKYAGYSLPPTHSTVWLGVGQFFGPKICTSDLFRPLYSNCISLKKGWEDQYLGTCHINYLGMVLVHLIWLGLLVQRYLELVNYEYMHVNYLAQEKMTLARPRDVGALRHTCVVSLLCHSLMFMMMMIARSDSGVGHFSIWSCFDSSCSDSRIAASWSRETAILLLAS